MPVMFGAGLEVTPGWTQFLEPSLLLLGKLESRAAAGNQNQKLKYGWGHLYPRLNAYSPGLLEDQGTWDKSLLIKQCHKDDMLEKKQPHPKYFTHVYPGEKNCPQAKRWPGILTLMSTNPVLINNQPKPRRNQTGHREAISHSERTLGRILE